MRASGTSGEAATTRPTVVLGTGSHAKVVIEILEAMGGVEIVGTVSGDPAAPERLYGHPLLGDWDCLAGLRREGIGQAVVAVGGWRDNGLREEVFHRARSAGFELLSPVHPSAVVAANVKLGQASMIGSGVTVMTEVVIGDNCIVSSGSMIGHETVIGDHVLVSGGAVVGGRVRLGDRSVVALGSVVLSDCVVGEGALVAAGSVVVKDVEAGKTVFGVAAGPRRLVRA